ncbi:hypothetical protein C8J57DRAFT_1541396 [Mycena rebaudengoi]|nr:hypothetical protein C8J57DRAFT_1541396 [Mycena rebaudengoi]
MSSRASTPPMNDDDDDLRGMLDAMAQSSPIAADRNSSGSAPPLALANQNIVAAARNYAQRKRLRGEQLTELDVFLNDPVLLRDAKLLANVFAVVIRSIRLFRLSQPTSNDIHTQTNIAKYAPAVLLSSKINVYKGDSPTDILLAILKKYRFDIPPGLEHNQADWAKVISAVQDALTQKRSKIVSAVSPELHNSTACGALPTEIIRRVWWKHTATMFSALPQHILNHLVPFKALVYQTVPGGSEGLPAHASFSAILGVLPT